MFGVFFYLTIPDATVVRQEFVHIFNTNNFHDSLAFVDIFILPTVMVTLVLYFICWPAESPVMLHCVLIGPLAHVMHACVSDSEALLRDVVHEVNPEGHLLVVVTRSKSEGHLAVSGVHHVLVPLGEVVGDALQQ